MHRLQSEVATRILSGPEVDRATLQLVGLLFSSILLPGLARAFVAQQQNLQKIGKGACCSKLNKDGTNEHC
eukprot:4033444-Amphidinium_carterae.1